MGRAPAAGMRRCSSCRKEQPQAEFGINGGKTCSSCLEHKRAKRKKPFTTTEEESVDKNQQQRLQAAAVVESDKVDLLLATCHDQADGIQEDVGIEFLDWFQLEEIAKQLVPDGEHSAAGSGDMTSSASGSGWGTPCSYHLKCTTNEEHVVIVLYMGEVPRITLQLMGRWHWFVLSFLLNSYWIFVVPNIDTLREMHWSSMARIIISFLCWLVTWCITGFVIGRNVTYAFIEREERHQDSHACVSKQDLEGGALMFY